VWRVGDLGDGGGGGELLCFGEQRVGPRQPTWVGCTAVNDGGERGLDPLLVRGLCGRLSSRAAFNIFLCAYRRRP